MVEKIVRLSARNPWVEDYDVVWGVWYRLERDPEGAGERHAHVRTPVACCSLHDIADAIGAHHQATPHSTLVERTAMLATLCPTESYPSSVIDWREVVR